MKTATTVAFFSLVLSFASATYADTFGSGSTLFEIDFVTIGDPGNADDFTGDPNPAGKVDYIYRIGQFEISEDMIDKANDQSLSDGDPLGITKDSRSSHKPATSINWFEAAKFVNWLNTSTGNTRAYKFDGGGNFQLWQSGDAGYDPNNLYRNTLAKYVLPSMDEWYKAAFYDATGGIYYDYTTGSNDFPDGLDFVGDLDFDIVVSEDVSIPEPNDITDVGLFSPYGTAGQGGNVYEWEETDYDLVNDSFPAPEVATRGYRGGAFSTDGVDFASYFRNTVVPVAGGISSGFRVASIAGPAVAGDFDGDFDVDGADFLILQQGLGTIYDADDLDDWELNYGFGTVASSNTAVPEPTTCGLALVAAMLCAIGRRRVH